MTQKDMEQALLQRYTPQMYRKIKTGKVAIAGLGGLGSHIAVMLTRSGVGHLLLVDFDRVDLTNLNRQNYAIQHLGKTKTEALKDQLKAINPFMTLETRTLTVTKDNIYDLFKDYPLLCEAFDQPEAKAMLIQEGLQQLPHTKIICASGMAGFDSSNNIKTTHPMKRLYVCGDGISDINDGTCLIAARVQICAGHQANMVIRLLLGIETI